MEKSEKPGYVRDWQEYIGAIGTLAFCPDEHIAMQVREHIKALKELVPLVADSKIRANLKKVV